MSYNSSETGRVKSIKSKFENLNSFESLDISAPIPNKCRRPSPKFLFKRSSTSIDLPISKITIANNNNNKHNSNSNNNATLNNRLNQPANQNPKNTYLRRHNNLDRTISADVFAIKKRNLTATTKHDEDTLKPLKEIKENVEMRLNRHTNDPIKRSSIKRSPAFRVGDKSNNTNNNLNNNNLNNNNNNKKRNDNCKTSKTNKMTAATTPNTNGKHTEVISNEFCEKFDDFLKRCDTDQQKLNESGLTDTLKAFLRQPLPSGPPPKKPPRTFIDSPNVRDNNHKSMLQHESNSDEHSKTEIQSNNRNNELQQKIDLLETQLVLKPTTATIKTKASTNRNINTIKEKEKSPFSSSLLNCIPCSSAPIYDTMIIERNYIGKCAALTANEQSPERNVASTNKNLLTPNGSSTIPIAKHLTKSKSHDEHIYMEPFAHLKSNACITKCATSTTNAQHNNNHLNSNHSNSNNHSMILNQSNETKLLSTSFSNGSLDGGESLGSSLISCTSCTADDHSISDLHDIHYLVSLSISFFLC